MIAVEDAFGVDIPDERAERVTTVRHVVECVEEIQAINNEAE